MGCWGLLGWLLFENGGSFPKIPCVFYAPVSLIAWNIDSLIPSPKPPGPGTGDDLAQVSMIRRLSEYHRRLWLAKPLNVPVVTGWPRALQAWPFGCWHLKSLTHTAYRQSLSPGKQLTTTEFIRPGQVSMARPVKTGGTRPPLPQTAWHLQSRQVFSFCLPWCARHPGSSTHFPRPSAPGSRLLSIIQFYIACNHMEITHRGSQTLCQKSSSLMRLASLEGMDVNKHGTLQQWCVYVTDATSIARPKSIGAAGFAGADWCLGVM